MATPDLSNNHDKFKMRDAEKLHLKDWRIMNRAPRPLASKPELLSPGGSLEKLRIAFLYGADAVYVSGKNFGLRGFAHNLDTEELAEASLIAHRLGKKMYVAVNIFMRQPDIKKIPPHLEYLQELKVDGLIISDPGLLLLARKYAPEIPIHLSTQANTTNSSSVEFWQEQGVRRINLARELSFREMAEIAGKSKAEIEIFVHGAMCMSYSGRCLMSAFLNHLPPPLEKAAEKNAPRPRRSVNRSANSGFCTQPCRWSWGLVEEKRPGEFFSVQQDSRGTYVFNSKDLCLLEEIGSLAQLGIDSFKIEGRMKGPLYVASVTRAYRQAIDRCAERCTAYGGRKTEYRVEPNWVEDLQKVSHRPYTKGNLFESAQTQESNVETRISYLQTHTLAGLVRPRPDGDSMSADLEAGGKIFVETRSRLVTGRRLEFLYPDGSSAYHLLDSFEDINGNRLSEAHPNRWIRFCVDFPVFPFQTVRVSNKVGPKAETEFIDLCEPLM
ncbi:Peptidase U32 [Syntrophobacter sp. SbD2]|nr:Peptidase U32 [Syntrophobacter sp. SbD2]